MKILNNTHWQTRDIKKLCTAVANAEGHSAHYKKSLVVRVRYSRSCQSHGWAYYKRFYLQLNIPKSAPIDTVELALVIAHEMAHNHNVRHVQLRSKRYDFRKDWREVWAWADAYEIRPQPVKIKPVITPEMKAEKKRLHAETMLEKWQRKQKNAAAKVKAWRQKTRYHERRLAAISRQKENNS